MPTNNKSARIEPLAPPYPPELQTILDRLMPAGVPPLTLFTTLARVPRIWDRFRAGSLLDRGPVSMRHREIVIDRTCARCHCVYEWGVHTALFADRVELTPDQVRAIAADDALADRWNADMWSDEERLIIQLVDELHDTCHISDELWRSLMNAFRTEQIFELIALVGFYHTVSFFANGLKLSAETYSPPFPS